MLDTDGLRRWAQMPRDAATLLDIAEPNDPGPAGRAYKTATAAVDHVADAMYAANDAMAREAWARALGREVERVG